MEDGHGQSSLSDLDDGLLLEILSRIRSTRKAFQCKLVCKRWCSLLCAPYFVERFRFRFRANQRMIEHDDDINSRDQSLGIIVAPLFSINFNLVAPDHGQSSRAIFALASCNDLILCQSVSSRENVSCYYLCNAFTKQWVALTPLTGEFSRISYGTRFGLIYELSADNCSIYRFRVVRFGDGVEANKYHSETCKWVQSDELLGKKYMFGSQVIVYSAKLVWVNTTGTSLYSYDPFNEQISSVDGPCLDSENRAVDSGFCVGECGGVLRIMGTVSSISSFSEDPKSLKVWDLETDQDGRSSWSLKHNIPIKTILSKDYMAIGAVGVGLDRKKDVVFLQSGHRLVSYNFQNGELRVEGQRKDGHLPRFLSVFQLQLPWWPTLIPSSNTTI